MAYDWEARAKEKQWAFDRKDNAVVAKVNQAYDRTLKQLDQDIDKIFATFGKKASMTPSAAKAYLNARVSNDYNAEAYRARVTRIQAIQQAARKGMTEVANVELPLLTEHLKEMADLSYGQMMFDMQSASGYGFKGVGVPSDALKSVLKEEWSGKNYSSRVWQNRDALAKSLSSIMLEHASMGKLSSASMLDLRGMVDTSKWLKQLKSKFKDATKYAKYAVDRLVRTESSFVCGQANAAVYDECDVEMYVFIAVLDTRTSAVCQDKDGEKYPVDEQEAGVNFPPLHPFCRSTTGAVIDGAVTEGLQRRARRPDGKTELVPRDMSYKEWAQWQAEGCPPLDKWRKMSFEGSSKTAGKVDQKGGKQDMPTSTGPKGSNLERFTGPPLTTAPDKYAPVTIPPPKYAKVLSERFEQGSPAAKKLYDQEIKPGGLVFDGLSSNPHYDPYEKHVFLSFKDDAKENSPMGPGTAWFHEHAHAIDQRRNITATWGGIEDTAKMEVDKLIAKKGSVGVKQILTRLPDSGRGLSDIFDGATKGEVNGGFGHTRAYWNRAEDHNDRKELFANFFEAEFSPEKAELMKKHLPKAWEQFNALLEKLTEGE